MASRLPAIAVAACLALPLSATAAVEPAQVFSVDYSVSFLGMTVARSTFVSQIGPNRYAVNGSLESAGLGGIFREGKAKASAFGRIEKDGFIPDVFSLDYVFGDKSRQASLRFAKGQVGKVSMTPPLPPPRADWVPVGQKELQAVLDPLSATLIRAKDLRSVCGRTAKLFNGHLRADVTLSYVNISPVLIGDNRVEAVACAGRFKPVAGFHRSNKAMQYFSNESRILLRFAELGKTGIYAPVQASVSTQIGTVSVSAMRFEKAQ